MPRPSLGRKPFTATMPEELLKRLDDHAGKTGKTRSDVIEDAVARALPKVSKPAKGK